MSKRRYTIDYHAFPDATRIAFRYDGDVYEFKDKPSGHALKKLSQSTIDKIRDSQQNVHLAGLNSGNDKIVITTSTYSYEILVTRYGPILRRKVS